MKIVQMIYLAVLVVFFQEVSADVITNDAAILPSPFSTNKVLTLTQSVPDGHGLFMIEIESLSSSQFNFSYAGIAEEYALFNVTVGGTLDPAFVLSNTPIVSNNGTDPGSSVQMFALNQSRFFGYWDDQSFDSHPDGNDNFGWVKITRTSSGLVAAAGVTAIGCGIIVGSADQVPEPASSALFLSGTVLFLSYRKVLSRNARHMSAANPCRQA